MTRTTSSRIAIAGHRSARVVLIAVSAGLVSGLATSSGCGMFGRSDQPDDTAEETIELRPAEPTTRRGRAEAALDRGSAFRDDGVPEAALAEFERAIELNPTLTVAYLGAGDIYREKGDFAQAETRYRTATELEPRNFDAQYGHGLVLQLLDRTVEAIRAYLRALSIRDDDFSANLNLATAYLQIGEAQEARGWAERAVRLDTSSGPARVNLGAVYAALNQHNAAVIEFQQAAELMPITPELLLNLADSLGKIGRYEEMAATLDQLIRAEPSAVAFERLGAARFRLRDYEEALVAFRSATEFDASHYPAWNGIGVCLLNRYVWSGKSDREAQRLAIEALRRSLRIEPGQTKIVELVRRYG